MKKVIAIFALAILIAAPVRATQTDQQSQSSADARAQAEAKSRAEIKSGEATLDAGSRIQADMDSKLDLRKAKPGDSFRMKTSRAVKRDGKEVISRGSTITGHVEQVTRAEGNTQATLVFDQIQDKKTGAASSLQAVVKAILKAEQPPMMDDQTEMRRPTSRQQSSGGVVGGVTNTVGGVVGQVNSTVNSTVGADAKTGGAVGSLGRGAIQIVTDTTTTVTNGSTLAVSNQSPRIDSGTRFILETTSALTLTAQTKEAKEKKN